MDYPHYIPRLWLLPALLALILPLRAEAGAIANLTDSEQVVEIRTSSGYIPRAIAPYATYSIMGGAHVRIVGRELYLDPDMEYALWPDGSFGPQRRIKRNRFR